MKELGVQCGIHYPDALHQHKPVKDVVGDLEGKFPVAERVARSSMSLPIYPEMTDEMVDYVTQTLLDVASQHSGRTVNLKKVK
jgi:dTDP-4-amino-4,6-dideoxygalactose transaminase